MCLLSADFQQKDMVFWKHDSSVSLDKKGKKRLRDFMPALKGNGVVFHLFFPEIIGNIWCSCVLQFFSSVTLCFFTVSIHAVLGISHRSECEIAECFNIFTAAPPTTLASRHSDVLEAFFEMLHGLLIPPRCFIKATTPQTRVQILLSTHYTMTCCGADT